MAIDPLGRIATNILLLTEYFNGHSAGEVGVRNFVRRLEGAGHEVLVKLKDDAVKNGFVFPMDLDLVIYAWWPTIGQLYPIMKHYAVRHAAWTVDLAFVRERSLAAEVPDIRNGQQQREQMELGYLRKMDIVFVVSASDRVALLAKGFDPAKIVLFPNLEDDAPDCSGCQDRRVIFVGGSWHHPNYLGLQWFMRDVWPLVRSAVPDAELSIVGDDKRQLYGGYAKEPGVTVCGFVEDLNALYKRARVSVAPIKHGAGINGKVLAAWKRGLPCVGTSRIMGEFGLSGPCTAAEFANWTVAALSDDGDDLYAMRDDGLNALHKYEALAAPALDRIERLCK